MTRHPFARHHHHHHNDGHHHHHHNDDHHVEEEDTGDEDDHHHHCVSLPASASLRQPPCVHPPIPPHTPHAYVPLSPPHQKSLQARHQSCGLKLQPQQRCYDGRSGKYTTTTRSPFQVKPMAA
ncbi:hypothetical protein VaNZ11_010893 [Volvox africanus]|uniref:Uncharacterized protein n=1 Tax=Volvox africanus TaxID=51714 RepID=A0ABQ5SBP4_9CHLO|nr:hypothetical protein VaNZ11_010893 [Volvox africanus]